MIVAGPVGVHPPPIAPRPGSVPSTLYAYRRPGGHGQFTLVYVILGQSAQRLRGPSTATREVTRPDTFAYRSALRPARRFIDRPT